jgi:quercetin dioxygenase-like cupin family protein
MWFLGGGIHTWKALAEETGNSMIVFEDELERGKVTPMHLHADVDEAMYVIEGEILLNVEGSERTVGAGGFTFAPRGCAHAFVVTSDRARVLAIQTPGSGQAFYRDASEPANESGTGPVDFDRIREVAAETGATTILGPPPFELAPR